MPYRDVLKRLFEKVEGAIGVGFVAQDGEAVQLEGQLDLAYQGILLQDLNRIHRNPKTNLRLVLSIHQSYTVVIKPLLDDYFLVLTLKGKRSLHKALRHLEQAAEELNQEL
jgi:hypothetical protein